MELLKIQSHLAACPDLSLSKQAAFISAMREISQTRVTNELLLDAMLQNSRLLAAQQPFLSLDLANSTIASQALMEASAATTVEDFAAMNSLQHASRDVIEHELAKLLLLQLQFSGKLQSFLEGGGA